MKKQISKGLQLSKKERELIFLTAWQILQFNSGRIKGFIRLYEARKSFYDKKKITIGTKEMKAYGILDRETFLIIHKILLSFDDSLTNEWLKAEILEQIAAPMDNLLKDYADALGKDTVGERYANKLRYKVWYYDKFLCDEGEDVALSLEKYAKVSYSPIGMRQVKILYNTLIKHCTSEADKDGNKSVKNDVYIASYKKGVEVKGILKDLLSETVKVGCGYVLEHCIIPAENNFLLGYGMEINVKKEKKKRDIELVPDPLISKYMCVSLPNSIRAKHQLEMIEASKMAEKESLMKEDRLCALLVADYSKEIIYQTMCRNLDYHFLSTIMSNTKLSENIKNRIINIGYMKLEYYDIDASDEEIEKNEFVRRMLLSAIVTELFSYVLSIYEEKLASKILKEDKIEAKEKKTKETNSFESTLNNVLEEKDREIEALKKEVLSLTTLKSENKELKKKLKNFEYEKRKALEQNSEEQNRVEEKTESQNEENETIKEPLEETKEMSDSEFREMIRGKKILIWGIREGDAKALQTYKELKCFVTKKGSKNLERTQLLSCDGVILCTNHSTHSMYYKARDMVKAAGLPYLHMRKTDTHISKYKEAIKNLCEGNFEENKN